MIGGEAIENFLDHYLKRNRIQNPTRPDFLDDADLEIDAPGEDPGEGAAGLEHDPEEGAEAEHVVI